MPTKSEAQGARSPCDCDGRFNCVRCLQWLCPECDGEPWIVIDAALYCEGCSAIVIDERKAEIDEVVSELRITTKFAKFDRRRRFAPTPREYDAGDREAYTENSTRAYNRHNCTNYDDVIDGLDGDDALSQACYDAVRARVEELLDDPENYEEDEPDDEPESDEDEESVDGDS